MLDEATSNLDATTENLIEVTLKEHLKNSTVIKITHRIRNCCNFDKVVVLERGRILEYGNPAELLNDDDTVFRLLCERSGVL